MGRTVEPWPRQPMGRPPRVVGSPRAVGHRRRGAAPWPAGQFL